MGLTAKRVKRLKSKPGRHRDGNGLLLQVTDDRVASWIFRYERSGRERWLGLGPLHTIDLAAARQRAQRAREQLLDGIDPVDAKRATRAAAELEASRSITFQQAAETYYAEHERKWKNDKSRDQWISTMRRYAFPIIGKLSVGAIQVGEVLRVMEQRNHEDHPGHRLWDVIPDTMKRLRGRIESVLDWATVRNYRTGDNPARWKGHLSEVLPQPKKHKHHAALPYDQIPAFMTSLRTKEGIAPLALEFLILTAARTSEVIGAEWGEIDLTAKVWTVPGQRIKGGKEHKVPLTDRAVEILKALPRERGNDNVFIAPSRGERLSNMAMAAVLKRMGQGDITVHGFRSTFRDWSAERTNFPNHVVEMALAHVIGSKVELAYRRGDLFLKRKQLMAAWDKYCSQKPVAAGSNVVAMRGAQ